MSTSGDSNEIPEGMVDVQVQWHIDTGVRIMAQAAGEEEFRVLNLDPEFARYLAQRITLASFKCDDAREARRRKM